MQSFGWINPRVGNPAATSASQAMNSRDDSDVPQRKRRNVAPNPHSDERLACPFYRNCPTTYQKYRSCAGPGWASIHRVKEHILRQHARPIHCMRCSTLFSTETELQDHLTLPAPCPLRIAASQPAGFNKEQEKALRKRSRGPAEKQWKEVYKILFPLVPEELIPSPRYENSVEEWEKRRRIDLDQMQTYIGLELPRKVKRRLDQMNFQLPRSLQNQFRRQVVEIVESAQADAFQSYRQKDTMQPMETNGPDASLQPSSSAQQSQTSYECGLEPALEAPALTTVTESTHGGICTSTAVATTEPFNQASGLWCDFESSLGEHDGMRRETEDADVTDGQVLGMSLEYWDFEGH